MTSTMLRPLASYTHTPVLSQRVYIRPPLSCVRTIQYYAPLLLCVCYHIPIHILCMCTCVLYSTRSVPPYMVLCHLLHIYMCAPKYTYTYQYYITYHLVCHHLISSSYYTTSGICCMACAIPRSVAYVLLCHVSSIPRYHVMECPYGHPYHHRISTYPHIHRIHGIHGIHDLDPFWHAKTRP